MGANMAKVSGKDQKKNYEPNKAVKELLFARGRS